jgi:hypothetical protein
MLPADTSGFSEADQAALAELAAYGKEAAATSRSRARGR